MNTALSEMNQRSREVFRQIVETYVGTGDPVGSRTLSRTGTIQGSAATIRNAMADLEEMGLLYAPHISAGRLPTEAGLRLYVDGLLEMGQLSEEERAHIESQSEVNGKTLSGMLDQATAMLSGLSACAGIVVTPKGDAPLRHIEFVPLSAGKALVVLVTANGMVENRIVEVPIGIPHATLIEAGNYLSSKLAGRSLTEARAEIELDLRKQRASLDDLTAKVVREGIAQQVNSGDENTVLIVRGQSKLLENVATLEELERIRLLFAALETKSNAMKLLEAAEDGDGVQIFIGSQTELFGLSGCSMILSPYAGSGIDPNLNLGADTPPASSAVGAIGVIGPLSMNYGQLIPMVDYTAKVISRLL